MVIQGKNLIVLSGGVALAMCKSCTLNVSTKLNEVASPTDGNWEKYVPGRKSWNVNTNHLVMSTTSMALEVGSEVTLTMKLADSEGNTFGGFVNNVTIESSSIIPAIHSVIVWDTTAKKFLITNGNLLNTKYYQSWQDGYEYMNPEFRLFTYNSQNYTVVNGELTKDELTGSAICKDAKVTGTVGNLLTGSWKWQGNGALTPVV